MSGPATAAVAAQQTRDTRLSPVGIVRAEAIKLFTVRSTLWTSLTAIVLAALIALLVGSLASGLGGVGGGRDFLLTLATVISSFVMLIVGVLGVLAIGGEYGTGMIRTSYTAVPTRLPALLAKGLVVGVFAFVVGLAAMFGATAIAGLLTDAAGIAVWLTADGFITGLIGAALAIAVTAVFGVGVGALVRNTAAGITVVVGILFVLPVVGTILAVLVPQEWIGEVFRYDLAAAAAALSASPDSDSIGAGGAALTLLGWVLAAWMPAALLTLRRDV